MKTNCFALLRMFLFAALVSVFSVSMISCAPESVEGGDEDTEKVEGDDNDENDDENDDEKPNEGDTPKDTVKVAVTGGVEAVGYTYADVSGYAYFNSLPAGGGKPVVGIEFIPSDAKDDTALCSEIISSLMGNYFSVSLCELVPDTEYKYRAFVTYDGITYRGEYGTFTTKEIEKNSTSPGNVIRSSCIKCRLAVVTAKLRLAELDAEEDAYVGIAYSVWETDIADGMAEVRMMPVSEVSSDGTYTITLDGISESSTYYYTSFIEIGGVRVYSSIKSFSNINQYHSVDLGLSVKWACCNVGAESPEDYGDYFSWGETEGKDKYNLSTYKWYSGYYETLTKYCTDRSYGTVDDKTVLDPEDDAATANWGNPWRMPTLDEIKELIDDCTWSWTTQNEVNGYKVTGPNGSSIFLPAAGYRGGTMFTNRGSGCYYWSTTLYEDDCYDAYALCFGGGHHGWNNDYRVIGLTVRPVTE